MRCSQFAKGTEREREERGIVNVIDRGDNHTAVGVTVVETTALFISIRKNKMKIRDDVVCR